MSHRYLSDEQRTNIRTTALTFLDESDDLVRHLYSFRLLATQFCSRSPIAMLLSFLR